MPDGTTIDFQREAYLEALLATLPETIAVFDSDLRILDLNQAGMDLLDISDLDELSENPPLYVISEKSRPKFKEITDKIFNGDLTIVSDAILLEILPVSAPHQLHECRLAPLKDPNGRIIAAVMSGRDVTRRYKALDQADRTLSILHSIQTTVPDAMIVIDEQGLIASCSDTAVNLFGYSESEMIGKNVNILMPSPYREEHDGYIARYLKSGEKRIIGKGREVKAKRKDGTIFPMRLEVGEANLGDYRLFTGFIHDLTRRHKTEERMQQMQSELIHASRLSAVGTLASSLAHELNQPLTAIANYLSAGRDMLEDNSPETQKLVQQALDESVTQSIRAGKIVHRLREFVSKGKVSMEVLSMAELVNESKTLGLIDARLKGVDYIVDIHPDINYVLADKVQIQQVMVNLMRNAIEAMEDSPVKQLTVAAHNTKNNRVEFIVRDTGAGIPPEIGTRLFDPFATSKTDGMGLGLSICKKIIQAHEGKLTAKPAPDGGTIFRFTLLKAPKEKSFAE